MTKMIRMQVQLTAEQQVKLKSLAVELSVSVSELVRQGVNEVLERTEREERWRRAWEVVGKFHDKDGATDVSVRHDDYLAEYHGEKKTDPR